MHEQLYKLQVNELPLLNGIKIFVFFLTEVNEAYMNHRNKTYVGLTKGIIIE